MNYKISVIIPTFNRSNVIIDALETVRLQTYANWECLIVDDGSSDNSEGLITNYIQDDSRYKFIKRPTTRRKGAATCRNIGLENANGQFVQFLDSDDLMASNKLEVQVNHLKNEALNSMATCRYGISRPPFQKTKIINGLQIFKDFDSPINLLKTFATSFSYFPLHSYMIPMSIIQKTEPWNEELSVNDDGEYFTRIILNSAKVTFCPLTYVIYRAGAGNRITTKITKDSGIKSYVDSWNMIDKTIYSKTSIRNHLYVQSAKANLLERLSRENKHLIVQYSQFLSERWENPNYLISKFLNKLRSFFFVSFTWN